MVMGVLAAVQAVFWVLVLTLATLYAVGILATRLIGQGLVFGTDIQGHQEIMTPFRTVPDSMFMLFKLMSGMQTDDDAAKVDLLMHAMPTVKFVFVWFTVTSSWTLLSILTAVVSDNMITTTARQEKFLQMTNADVDRKEHDEELRALFHDIDEDKTGTVTPAELQVFLESSARREACAHVCRVPARDVVDVLDCLFESSAGKAVDMEDFIRCLHDVGNVVTEKSVMKLEARLHALEKMTEDTIRKLDAWQPRCNQDVMPKLESQSSPLDLDCIGDLLERRFRAFEKTNREAISELVLHQKKSENLWLESMLDARLSSLQMNLANICALGDRTRALRTVAPAKDDFGLPLPSARRVIPTVNLQSGSWSTHYPHGIDDLSGGSSTPWTVIVFWMVVPSCGVDLQGEKALGKIVQTMLMMHSHRESASLQGISNAPQPSISSLI